MKKILTFIFSIVFSLNIFLAGIVNADLNESDKAKYIIKTANSRQNLEKTTKGKSYIKSIDSIIEKYSENEDILEKIYQRVDKALEKDIKNNQVKNVLEYLNNRAKTQLLNILELEKNAIIGDEVISDEDKKYIEDKIVELQLNALEKASGNIEYLTDKFENLTNYEESGDFEMGLNIDYDLIGKIDSKLNINDYSSLTSNFDGQFKGEIEALLNASISGKEDEIKFHLNSMLDLISKDGNIYLLLEDFDIIDSEGIDELKGYMESLKEIAEKNDYIKFENSEANSGIELLKNLNPNKILNDSKIILSEPLVTAYKKEDNRYYLKPTKYACDKFKELSNKFDPFNPKNCTEGQYNNLLKDLAEAGEFYAEIDNDSTKIVFEGNNSLGFDKNSGYIVFKNDRIEEINYTIQEGNNLAFFDYIANKKLDIIYREDSKNIFTFYSTLDYYNNFDYFTLDTDIDSYYSTINGNLKLEKRDLSGEFNHYNKSYNWETEEYENSYNNNFVISGEYRDSLEELEINYTGTNLEEDKEDASALIKYNDSYFEFNANFEDEGYKIDIESNGELDNNNMLKDLIFNMDYQIKNYSYNYDTWEIEYTGEFYTIANIDFVIDNKNINGTTIIYDKNSNEILKIENSGNYGNSEFKLENKIKVDNSLIKYFFYNSDEDMEINYNLDFDLNYPRNDAEIFINTLLGETEILNFYLKNTGTKYYKDIEIETPENIIDSKEIFDY